MRLPPRFAPRSTDYESPVVVELRAPVRETFGGMTLAQALAWCLVAMMACSVELGLGAPA